MSALTDSLKKLIAKYLNISTRLINELTIINALPYSDNAIEVIEKTFERGGLSDVSKIGIIQLEDNIDTILVCKCVLKDNRSFVSLVFDPEELYQSLTVLKMIDI